MSLHAGGIEVATTEAGRGLVENKPIPNHFKNMGFDTEKRSEDGVYEMRMAFRDLDD